MLLSIMNMEKVKALLGDEKSKYEDDNTFVLTM